MLPILDFDGIIANTVYEDLLCLYHVFREYGIIEDLGDISPGDFLSSGILDLPLMGFLIEKRPYVLAVEHYLGFARAYLAGDLKCVQAEKYLNPDDIKRIRKDFYDARQRMKTLDYNSWIRLIRPYDGMLKVISKLGNIAIATGRGRESTEELLEIFGISRYVVSMRTREFGGTKGDMIESILKETGERDGFFVDDSLRNLLSAVESGVDLYLGSWGYTTREELKLAEEKGIQILKSPGEILHISHH